MNLPAQFCENMKNLLGEEYDEFIAGYQKDVRRSLRVNTLKGTVDEFLIKNPFSTQPIDWCRQGFYYDFGQRPGKHPYHRAGVYYIQEASAMAPVAALDIQLGDKVLDLCAAPGGKSSGRAAALQGKGLIVSNEIVSSRAKILSSNLERMGVKNALVLNHSPKDLENIFPYFFDKIIVDAPCSGEGMFRKDADAADQWSVQAVEACGARQSLILESAHKMLAKDGVIVYSTCTFSPQENEQVIAAFLANHSEYTVVKPRIHRFFEPGSAQWADGNPLLANTMRLFPHKIKGEGHFVAVLKKEGGENGKIKEIQPLKNKKQLEPWYRFEKQYLQNIHFENLYLRGQTLYSLPDGMVDFTRLKVLRAGVRLGEIKKDRFDPDHSLRMVLKADQVKYISDFSANSREIEKYLNGQTLPDSMEKKGYRLICCDGYSIGWGKSDGSVIKNHYPKGLRTLG